MKKLWLSILKSSCTRCLDLRICPLLVLIIAGFSSCNDHHTLSHNDTLRCYLMTDPFSFDPRVGGDYRSQLIVGELFEGLMRVDKEGVPQLALAKSYTVSADRRIYTFVLRPSLWSNGDSVTAFDFEYAWKSVISRTVQTKHASAFFCIKNAQRAFENACSIDEVGIRVLNEMTLQVELEHPAGFFLEWVANPLYSPVYRSTLTSHSIVEPFEDVPYISNGPYLLSKREINRSIELSKNPTYWNAQAVRNKGILFSIIEDPATAYNLFCAGELDWFGEPFGVMSPEMTESLLRQNRLTIATVSVLNWIRCNVRVKPLSSIKIRKAIACSIDREEISSKLMFDHFVPAFTIVPKKYSLLQDRPFQDHDSKQAKKLFQEGLSELGYTKETFPSLTLSCQSDVRTIAMCELLVQQIHEALGIDIKLHVYEMKRLWEDVFQNRFEMSYSGWVCGLTDPIYNLESIKEVGGHYRMTGWKNKLYADLLNASDAEINPQKRNELLFAAEKLALDEMPVIPVFEVPFRYAKQNNLQGEFFTHIGRLELCGLTRNSAHYTQTD